MHSETLLSSMTLHAQSRKIAQMCLRKCSDPNPGTQVCANFKRLCCSRFMDPAQPSSASASIFLRGYHVESFAEKIGNYAQNDIGDFHLTGIRIHCPRRPGRSLALAQSLSLKGPPTGKIWLEAVLQNTLFMRKWYERNY